MATDTDKQAEKIKRVVHLQTKVLERFMTPEQIDVLTKEYKQNTYHGTKDRFANLEQALTRIERRAMKAYLFSTNGTLNELGKELGFRSAGMIQSRAGRAALKIAWQHKDKLGLEELIKK